MKRYEKQIRRYEMRYIKILLLGICILALSFGTADAGLNPADPGLAGGTATYKLGLSRICIDCHSRIPGGGAQTGTHFVVGPGDGAITRSGGGWTSLNSYGAREGREYFRLNMWMGGSSGHTGTWSKYGDSTDNTSYYTAAAIDNTGLATTDTTLANYAAREIICESCHNLVKNVAGGNNLVAPMTSGTYTADTGNATQANPWNNGTEATLCVGCHGFMYTSSDTANAATARYGDDRNSLDGALGTEKGNNHAHYVDGVKRNQNHHVMTGDRIQPSMAAAWLLWRDTSTVDTTSAGWPSGSEAITTTYTAGARGQFPMLATWDTDGGKAKPSTATDLNCVHCHSAPHSGATTLGASIIRDTNSGGSAADELERLGEGSRAWMGFSDANFCQDCHQLRP
jgi:hypothetical protein